MISAYAKRRRARTRCQKPASSHSTAKRWERSSLGLAESCGKSASGAVFERDLCPRELDASACGARSIVRGLKRAQSARNRIEESGTRGPNRVSTSSGRIQSSAATSNARAVGIPNMLADARFTHRTSPDVLRGMRCAKNPRCRSLNQPRARHGSGYTPTKDE